MNPDDDGQKTGSTHGMTDICDVDGFFKRVGMVAVRLFWVWLAIFLGDVLVWSAYAYTQAEPTRTFILNFISSTIPFLAGLSTGGAVIITIILEISDYFKSGKVGGK